MGSKTLAEQACVVNSMSREFSGRTMPAPSKARLKKERRPFMCGSLVEAVFGSHVLLCEILMKPW